jgi:hypothetical protein
MLPLEAALEGMERLGDENVLHLIQFVRASRRGFTREPRPRDRDSADGTPPTNAAAEPAFARAAD